MPILKCGNCGRYTLSLKCPACKKLTKEVLPPKYSPEDKWGKWRRAAKREIAARKTE